MSKKINIDYWRLIAAIMIVAIHVYPFISIHESVDYIVTRVMFRICVPLFLMITGYFILPKAIKDWKDLKKYTIKILKIYLICVLIYLPINIYNGYFSDIHVVTFMKDIIINGTFYHLWYFPALILGIWVTYLLVKIEKTYMILALFFIGLLGDSYYGFIHQVPILKSFYDAIFMITDYTRNGLFYVPIFLLIGYLGHRQKLSIKVSQIGLLVCFLLMIVEGTLLYQFQIPRHSSMYLFLVPFSYFLFQWLCCHEWESNKTVRNIAMFVYILHPLFIVVIRLCSKILPFSVLQNSIVFYIVVVLVTLFFSMIVEKVKSKLVKKEL